MEGFLSLLNESHQESQLDQQHGNDDGADGGADDHFPLDLILALLHGDEALAHLQHADDAAVVVPNGRQLESPSAVGADLGYGHAFSRMEDIGVIIALILIDRGPAGAGFLGVCDGTEETVPFPVDDIVIILPVFITLFDRT